MHFPYSEGNSKMGVHPFDGKFCERAGPVGLQKDGNSISGCY